MRASEIVCKPTVVFKRFTPAAVWYLKVLDAICETGGEGVPPQMVITSANDSVHMVGSRHYMDEAWDLRSHNFPAETRERFRKRLEAMLNSHPTEPGKFLVIFEDPGTENEHFHSQVRNGQSFSG